VAYVKLRWRNDPDFEGLQIRVILARSVQGRSERYGIVSFDGDTMGGTEGLVPKLKH